MKAREKGWYDLGDERRAIRFDALCRLLEVSRIERAVGVVCGVRLFPGHVMRTLSLARTPAQIGS